MRSKQGAVGPVVFTVIGVLVLLPLLYVLSTGPVIGLVAHGYLSERTSLALYAPLDFACQRCTPLENVMAWYVDLFQPTYDVPPGVIYGDPSAAQPAGATITLPPPIFESPDPPPAPSPPGFTRE